MKSFAVIGYGGQGAWHCEQLQNSNVTHLCGIYDVREVRRNAALQNGIHVYNSINAIFSDPAVDAVIIATPNDLHDTLVTATLSAGKHVICEKPVAMSVSALDHMIEVAQNAGKLFTVFQNRRWDVDFLAMKQIAHSSIIGDLINIESRIHGSRGIPSDWRCEKAHGGGMLLDWGVHLIDQILLICDKPVHRVSCVCSHITNQEVDDGFKLNLTFEGGSTAYIEVGTYNFLPLPRFYMQCSQGSVLITDWRHNAHIAQMTAWQEKDITPVQNAAGITKTMAPRDELTLHEYDIERPVADVYDFYRNFCAALDGKAVPLIALSQVRRVMRVIEAAFQSDAAHQSIDVHI